MFSETTRRMSLDPYRSFRKKQKQTIQKRASLSPDRSHDLPLFKELNMTEIDLFAFLESFLLSQEDLMNLGYPMKNQKGEVVIYKGIEYPKFTGAPTNVNARTSSSNSDSGISSSSGNSSDSTESFDGETAINKAVKRKTEKKIQAHDISSTVKRAKSKEIVNYGSNTSNKTTTLPPMHLLHHSVMTYEPISSEGSPEPICETVRLRRADGSIYRKYLLYHPMFPEYKVSNKLTVHSCARCSDTFYLTRGNYIGHKQCSYHSMKLLYIDGELRYKCCLGLRDSEPCTQSDNHVWNGLNKGLNGPFADYKETEPSKNKLYSHGIYAIDCEMVYTQHGMEVAKVTVVGVRGSIVYESYIKPTEKIWDYNTNYSGITSKQLKHARPLSLIQTDLLKFISAETILIGHGLENDLRALKIVHKKCIDTTMLYPHRNGLPYKRGLKSLAWSYLRKEIQAGSHCSMEDSLSCLELVLWMVREKRLQLN